MLYMECVVSNLLVCHIRLFELLRNVGYTVLRLCRSMSSVCSSVCPSVMFRYHDHIGWNSLKICAVLPAIAQLLFC